MTKRSAKDLVHQEAPSYSHVQRVHSFCHRDANYAIANTALLGGQAFSFASEHQHNRTSVASLAIVCRAVGRGADDRDLVEAGPTTELIDRCSHKCLLEECSHGRSNYSRVERVYAIAKQDESCCTRRGGCSHKRTQVPRRTNVAQRSPARTVDEIDLIESQDSLTEDRCDAGCTFGPGNSSKLLGCHPSEWNSGAFESANEFSGEWLDEQLLAVEQSVYREVIIDGFDEVAYAFDEKEPA